MPGESVDSDHSGGRIPGLLLCPPQSWPYKNHLVLLKSLPHLARRGVDVRLFLTGEDQGTVSRLQEFVRANELESLVEFRGLVSREELPELFQKAQLLVHQSYFGPDNLAPLEAMCWGLPVLAADVPGQREQLGEAPHFLIRLMTDN